jgi:hypothetical protein
MVVFPAASRPTIRIRISFFPRNFSNNFEMLIPMLAVVSGERGGGFERVWKRTVMLAKNLRNICPGQMYLCFDEADSNGMPMTDKTFNERVE